ncbi:6-phosphogluconolactonase [Billgrantia pellis]|uniref:6-phosphogluconolactonase n=1 Tax=Billgrantia pellis TaxID=2606936 RepID=A0A7V7KII1_9GAMM|nr:6-phosphogluconolactonase [Halomonas pellis]KAA0012710.1 6-phosphogluconolactonase [Halomonas pellis]
MIQQDASPREQLAVQLAEAAGEALRQDLSRQDRVLLVLSGGSTPVPFFQALAGQELPWSRVDVTLADERWVAETDEASNARLVRRHLLKGPAAKANFISLITRDPTPEQGVEAVTRRIVALPWPASLVVLGMGGDGHTASLFPDSRELELGLTTDAPVLAARTPSQPQARITLSADRLHQAQRHALHITGDDKRSILAHALAGDDSRELPIRAFLSCPLAVYWAP